MMHDDVTQLIDMVESYRDTMNSTREVFAESISLRMNDTMRILTVFSVMLLPLSFVTGVFSMSGFNLENVSDIPRGFAIIAVSLAGIAAILLFTFWKREWIFVREDNNIIDILHANEEGEKDDKSTDSDNNDNNRTIKKRSSGRGGSNNSKEEH